MSFSFVVVLLCYAIFWLPGSLKYLERDRRIRMLCDVICVGILGASHSLEKITRQCGGDSNRFNN